MKLAALSSPRLRGLPTAALGLVLGSTAVALTLGTVLAWLVERTATVLGANEFLGP